MPLFVSSSAHVIPFVAQSFVATAWQGVLLVACVSGALYLLRGVSAAARSLVWTAVLALLVALPFLDMHMLGGRSADIRREVLGGGFKPAAVQVGMEWAWIFVAVWMMFSAFRLVQLIRSAWHVRQVSSRAVELTGPQCVALGMDELAAQCSRSTKICVSGDVGVPCVAGFFTPRVLLPPELLTTLSAGDLRQIVQHELEHLQRRDDWVNLLQKVGLVLLPLSPGLWWVERRLCAERELACDDRVLRETGAPKAYARCLANLAEQSLMRRSLSLVLGAWHRRSALAVRIHRILRAPKASWSPAASAASVVVLLGAVIGTALVLVGTSPLVDFRGPASLRGPSGQAVAALTPLPAHGLASAKVVEAVVRRPAKMAVALRAGMNVQPGSRTGFAGARMVEASARVPRKATARSDVRSLVAWQRMPRASGQPLLLQDDLHYTYAAIPTTDGWFIVQL